MKTGLFVMPTNPPERSTYDAVQQTLETVRWCDQLGYEEAWFGEHLTVPWEPLPACDLLIAQALGQTERIKLCSGAYLLPFYHPAELACRIMQLDHMAQGRFMCGIAAGFSPTDMEFVGIDPGSDMNHRMMLESLEIMMRIWTDHVGSEWTYEGEFWTVRNPGARGAHMPHLRPFQAPHPPLAMAGMSPRSSTLKLAGERGYIPISLMQNTEMLADHWTLYEESADAQGLTADRGIWRVARDTFVADSDAEAENWVLNSAHARFFDEAVLPAARRGGRLGGLKHDPSVPDDEVTTAYLMEHHWLVGSAATVAQKLEDLHRRVGGFGTIVQTKLDWGSDPEQYRHSLELFATDVLPAVEAAVEPVA